MIALPSLDGRINVEPERTLFPSPCPQPSSQLLLLLSTPLTLLLITILIHTLHLIPHWPLTPRLRHGDAQLFLTPSFKWILNSTRNVIPVRRAHISNLYIEN